MDELMNKNKYSLVSQPTEPPSGSPTYALQVEYTDFGRLFKLYVHGT